MKWLFIYAHPDDECVAAGGTIRKLVDAGDEVILVIATGGGGGSIKDEKVLRLPEISHHFRNTQDDKISLMSLETLSIKERRLLVRDVRKLELKKSCELLGISKYEVLDFEDGKINNEVVWGSMVEAFVEQIEKHKPDAVVTFDHTGWYFHIDHVGVSLATIKAMQQSKHKIEMLLFNIFHPPGIKERWKYHYPKNFPITHKVSIVSSRKVKADAIRAHASQKINFVDKLLDGEMDEEYFQLVKTTKRGKKMLDRRSFFESVIS